MDIHGTNVIYAKRRSNETSLEPNHTQFIFIDDGDECAFRSRFEKAMAGQSLDENENKSISSLENVPVVLLVIDGGRDTIRKGR